MWHQFIGLAMSSMFPYPSRHCKCDSNNKWVRTTHLQLWSPPPMVKVMKQPSLSVCPFVNNITKHSWWNAHDRSANNTRSTHLVDRGCESPQYIFHFPQTRCAVVMCSQSASYLKYDAAVYWSYIWPNTKLTTIIKVHPYQKVMGQFWKTGKKAAGI